MQLVISHKSHKWESFFLKVIFESIEENSP